MIALGQESEERTFIVTAYYSPLPNQSFYLRWNYEDEVVLNGEWVRWASGKKVFPWMLAAPKNYPFWTKIELEWVGIWSVEDRGWAIVNAGKRWYEHDRIDVWMWYGDEWLRKALSWWKRKVKWVVYWKINKTPTISLSNIKWTNKNSITQVNKSFNIFYNWIWKDSSKEEIELLQKFLKEVWIYDGDIDGKYNINLINNLYTFQKKYNIVTEPDDIWAGYWWIQTRKKIQKMYKDWEFKAKNTIKEKEFELFSQPISSTSPEEHIKELQEFFTSIEYYDGEINGKYDDIFSTVVDYQIEKNLIKDEKEQAAWYWGPKTRSQAKVDYEAFQEKKRKEQEFIKKMENLKLQSLSKADEMIQNIWNIEKWDTGSNVRELQKTLKKLWFFEEKDTAIFWDKTEEAILKYQISKELIQKKGDIWAGKVWPKTKEALKTDIANLLLQEELEQEQVTMK
jgi:peptidoglycan hydrolase-like protein with peptidoglycan-binding domain/3D (Asp-Asp-Asp) domain-containing protein